jgi:hypothetical protein
MTYFWLGLIVLIAWIAFTLSPILVLSFSLLLLWPIIKLANRH